MHQRRHRNSGSTNSGSGGPASHPRGPALPDAKWSLYMAQRRERLLYMMQWDPDDLDYSKLTSPRQPSASEPKPPTTSRSDFTRSVVDGVLSFRPPSKRRTLSDPRGGGDDSLSLRPEPPARRPPAPWADVPHSRVARPRVARVAPRRRSAVPRPPEAALPPPLPRPPPRGDDDDDGLALCDGRMRGLGSYRGLSEVATLRSRGSSQSRLARRTISWVLPDAQLETTLTLSPNAPSMSIGEYGEMVGIPLSPVGSPVS